MTKEVLRWILVLPAALVAWMAGSSLGDLWMQYIYPLFVPWQPVSEFEIALFPSAFSVGLFTFVAARVAPSSKFPAQVDMPARFAVRLTRFAIPTAVMLSPVRLWAVIPPALVWRTTHALGCTRVPLPSTPPLLS